MTDYLAHSIAWSSVGLVVGFVLGKTEVTIRGYIRSHFRRTR